MKACKPHEKTKQKSKGIKMLDLFMQNWKLRVRCSLFHFFFHVICKISNFNMWTRKVFGPSFLYWVHFKKTTLSNLDWFLRTEMVKEDDFKLGSSLVAWIFHGNAAAQNFFCSTQYKIDSRAWNHWHMINQKFYMFWQKMT